MKNQVLMVDGVVVDKKEFDKIFQRQMVMDHEVIVKYSHKVITNQFVSEIITQPDEPEKAIIEAP